MELEFCPEIDYNADIATYKRTRKRLRQIDTSDYTPDHIAHVNAMIRDCDYIIQWLETGSRPGLKRGIERRAGYQREMPMDMDMMRRYMGRGARGDQEAHPEISRDQMVMMEEALDILTIQQRDAFIMVAVNRFSLEMAADIMGLKKTSVQNHVDRAKAKIAAFITKYHYQTCMPITG
jgi:positive control factor